MNSVLLILCVLAFYSSVTNLSQAVAEQVDRKAESKSRNWFSGIRGNAPFKRCIVIRTASPVSQTHGSDAIETTQVSIDGIKEQNEEELIAIATKALEDGQIEVALDHLLPILNQNASHQLANAWVGAILLGLNQTDVAESLLHSAVSLSNFKDYRSVANLGIALRQRGELGLALRVLLKGLEVAESAEDPIATLSRGIADVYVDLKNFTEASDWFLNAALHRPSEVENFVLAARVGDSVFAENVLLRGLQFHPNSSLLYYQLGLVMINKDRIKEAVTLLEQAVRLDEKNGEAVMAAATALHAVGEFESALQYYVLALKLEPDNIILLANLSRLMQSLGRREEALQSLQRAASLSADHPEVAKAARELGVNIVRQT
eukprot:scaffold1058_cov155-Ochromonas_danica.AAC.44